MTTAELKTVALTEAANHATNERLGELPSLLVAEYDQLRALAVHLLADESRHHSLNPTALVHEAFLRLVDNTRITRRGAAFFRGCFARECRRVLVDHARHRQTQRNGGGWRRLGMDCALLPEREGVDLLELNEALETMARLNERMARIVELRVFGGMTVPECGEVLGVSPRTVDKDWRFGLTWLKRELG